MNGKSIPDIVKQIMKNINNKHTAFAFRPHFASYATQLLRRRNVKRTRDTWKDRRTKRVEKKEIMRIKIARKRYGFLCKSFPCPTTRVQVAARKLLDVLILWSRGKTILVNGIGKTLTQIHTQYGKWQNKWNIYMHIL